MTTVEASEDERTTGELSAVGLAHIDRLYQEAMAHIAALAEGRAVSISAQGSEAPRVAVALVSSSTGDADTAAIVVSAA